MADNLDVTNAFKPALSSTGDAPVLDISRETTTDDFVDPKQAVVEPPAAEPKPKPEPKTENGVEKRFGELAQRRREAEERARQADERLAKALEALERVGKPAVPDGKPKRDQFDDPDAYEAALEAYGVAQGKQAGVAEATAKQQREAEEAQLKATHETFLTRVEEARGKVTDFDEVVFKAAEDGGPVVTPMMGQMIAASENGPAIAYHLGNNVELSQKIAAMPPAMQLFEMGKLAAIAKLQPRVTASKAPAPIRPVGARNTSTEKSPAEMTGDEYLAHRFPHQARR